mgnify:CR=1 FL=1
MEALGSRVETGGHLQWDPGEYGWSDPFKNDSVGKIPFFQYSVKLGRRILAHARRSLIAALKFWELNNIPADFMRKFWKQLWAWQQAAKITSFHWLIAHRALPVGSWMGKMNKQASCGPVNQRFRCGAEFSGSLRGMGRGLLYLRVLLLGPRFQEKLRTMIAHV